MKKYLGLLLAALLLTGCGSLSDPFEDSAEATEEGDDGQGQSQIDSITAEEQEEEGSESSTASQELQQVEKNQVEEGEDSPSRETLEERREAAGLSESNISGLKLEQSGNYYYEQCNDEERTLYVELYQILKIQEKDILLTTKNPELLSRVYQCVINDHPELFYLNGYTYTQYTKKDKIQYMTFTGRYLYDPEEVESRQQRIDEVVARNWDMFVGYDEYGTVKAVYEFLIFGTDYSMESSDNQNICSVFLDKKSVCNGYAKAAQYLLNQLGIPCMIVNGDANGAHAWNIVEIDGAYYHMDATWGDPSYYSSEADSNSITPDIDYSYFCVTTEEICKNHRIDTAFDVPECTATEANYFVREGLYLTGFEEEKIAGIFKRAKESGDTSAVIKASGRQAYDEIYDNLITQQKIFDYFGGYNEQGEYTIAYSGNEELYTINFWM